MRNFFLVFLLVFTFLFFLPSLNFYFISDDFIYTRFNNLGEIFRFWQEDYHYNPVFWLFLFGLKSFFGFQPAVFHLTAVIVHLLNVVLVFFLSRQITKDDQISSLTAFGFALFFSHYEVVLWVTGLSTSLMFFSIFFLFSVLLSFLTKKGRFFISVFTFSFY